MDSTPLRLDPGAHTGWLALALMMALAFPATALDILVPAYGNPCCGDGPAMWSQLIAAASTPNRSSVLHVVFNPASGPGNVPDPNYVDASGQAPLPNLRSAGAILYGYVATGFGSRPATAVRADIDAYLIGHYAGLVDGIFFDELSTDLARVGEHQSFVAHVRLRRPGAPAIGNPGTTGVLNPSGQSTYSAFDYAAVFDMIVSFENTGVEYRTNYLPPPYLAAKPARGVAHVIHSDGVFDLSLLSLAASRRAGVLYVTDDILANPYDRLPTGWARLLAAAAAFPAPTVPSSSTYFLWIIGGALLAVGTRFARPKSRTFRARRFFSFDQRE